MTDQNWATLASRLGAEAAVDGAPTRWFEQVWSAADRGEVDMPWDRDGPHPLLLDWLSRRELRGGRAVVVGCGLGADAEYLAASGFTVTAFDVSPTAVRAARARHPRSSVVYRVADLLALPPELRGAFDLVVEIFTIQALPPSVRARAVAGVRSLVARGGTLFAVQMVREEGAAVGAEPPWLLDRAEMVAFAGTGLALRSLRRMPLPGLDDHWRAVLDRR